MKIVVIGTRGIPNILGGVETHCEELYPRIVAKGHDVIVIRRTPYVTSDNKLHEYKGIKLVDVKAPKKKSLEAIVHTFKAVLTAKKLKPDVLHVHAIGPALMTPLARLLGMKVVMTNHGPDYDRKKWGKLAKFFLKTGERFGAKHANKIIVISNVIKDILKKKYGRTDAVLIFNGVNKPVKSSEKDWLQKWGITKHYIFAMGRFVEEKGFHDLIDAFVKSNLADNYQLVLAGDADHPTPYSNRLKQLAQDNNVILTGFIKGEPLNQALTNASLFVMPSYHEGLPIALLEAMSYDLDILVSDIPANQLPELKPDDFFRAGDVDSLLKGLIRKTSALQLERHYDLSRFDWDVIAKQTIEVYDNL